MKRGNHHDCAVCRQPTDQAARPPALPAWTEHAPQPLWRQRLQSVVSVSGYAALTMLALGATILMARAWAEWLTR